MPFALIFTLYEFLVAKWFAFVMTVHEDLKNKAIVNDAMERANAIDRQNAEERAKEARVKEVIELVTWTLRQPEFSELINESETVKTLETRVKALVTENDRRTTHMFYLSFFCVMLTVGNCAHVLWFTSR
jgi:hypothetical protein